MSIRRLINPSSLMNEKNMTYNVSFQNQNDVASLLETVKDGVFGIEVVKSDEGECFSVFAPIHFKINLNTGTRHAIFDSLYSMNTKDVTIAHFYLEKASMFTVEMNNTFSFWNIINSIVPSSVNVIYQLLLSFRQDNWKENLTDQYYCYLNGIENPSQSGLIRKLQVSINEKVDSLLRWEYNHVQIDEVESKINQDGFRYNFRIILTKGNKKQREKLLNKIKQELNKHSFINNWLYITSTANKETISEIVNRKFNSIAKSGVLCSSELIPFISYTQSNVEIHTQNNVEIHTQKPQISFKHPASIITKNTQTENNNLFKLLPLGEELSEIEYEATANSFMEALKEVKPFDDEMRLVQSKAGINVMKLTFNFPKGLKFSEINKTSTISDIQIKMGIRSLSIRQGENTGEIDVIVPLEFRRKVLLRNYIDTDKFRVFIKNNPLPFLSGVDEVGEPIYKCLSKAVHLLVAGSTGSGKSVWFNQAILTMLISKKPLELQMYMIDIKQVELTQFKDFPHVQSVITDANEAIKLLSQLTNETDRRYKLFTSKGVNRIELYNKNIRDKLPYIVCVIDEYAELAMRNKAVHSYVQSLTQLARAAGIHLIIATQRPSVDVIDGTIKSNLPSKIAFRCANTQSYLTILNNKPKYDLLGNGDGVMEFEGEEQIRFQGCLIVDDVNNEGLEGKLISKIASITKDEKVYMDLPIVEEIKEESELDKLKRLIVNTDETRIAQLQKVMRININKLNEMMQELCKEGFLEKGASRSQGYKLIANEEEIMKWKD